MQADLHEGLHPCMNEYDLMNGFFPTPPVLHCTDQNQMTAPEISAYEKLLGSGEKLASPHTLSHLILDHFLTFQLLPRYITTFTLILS